MTAEIRFVDGETMQYTQVRLLDNGWVKAAEPAGGEDYIPPNRVENVTGRVYVGNGGPR